VKIEEDADDELAVVETNVDRPLKRCTLRSNTGRNSNDKETSVARDYVAEAFE
jgi:hypothetical protein